MRHVTTRFFASHFFSYRCRVPPKLFTYLNQLFGLVSTLDTDLIGSVEGFPIQEGKNDAQNKKNV